MGGFPVRQIIIWERSGGINCNPGYFLPNYEVVYLIAKPAFVVGQGAGAGCVWRIHQEANNPHPAPFPFALADRCVRAAGPGVVLDPFIGSGTTALAAIPNNREWVGIEISPQYLRDAEHRISKWRDSIQGRLALDKTTAAIPLNEPLPIPALCD